MLRTSWSSERSRVVARAICLGFALCGVLALTSLHATPAHAADGKPWGDGPKSTTFDDGGISPAVCKLDFSVVERAGKLDATANVGCNAKPGPVAGIFVNFYVDNLTWKRHSAKFTNTYSVTETLQPDPGTLCIGAQGVKNESLTGSSQVKICGKWPQ